ncbi:MAG: helix-turn-helix domain-containing protein [Planctomycetota bacterium]|nr:helix-turn-helix domain-containing protein [Planctomycetota bacterium]
MNNLETLEVCSAEEIGQKLRTARELASLGLNEAARRAGVEQSSLHHWENGREGGACHVTRAGLAVGLWPNDLLLKSAPLAPADLNAIEQAQLREVFAELRAIRDLCEGFPALATFASHLKDVRAMIERRGVPAGARHEWTPQRRKDLKVLHAQVLGELSKVPTESLLGHLLKSVSNELRQITAPQTSAKGTGPTSVIQDPAAAYGSPAAGSGGRAKARRASKKSPRDRSLSVPDNGEKLP